VEKDLKNIETETETTTPEEVDLADGTESIKEIDITKEMKTSFLNYAMSVIVSRAIPDVRDGMKPVHRRILYAMNELGMHSDKPFKKSARIVGEVMGKFHPHGDSAIYESMVRMAQDFSYRYPLVEGHGNFGSIDGDGAAAMRYTEARLSKIAMEVLKDLKKDTVDFQDNYDGSEKEPTVLPCKIPNLLVNGATGIAVGMATNIPPHNLSEVIDGIIALINNPDISIEGLMAYIKGPDFPTGGRIMGISQVRKAYLTGNGAITLRAKHAINDLANGKQEIVITEIPFQVNKSRLIEKMADTIKNKLIEGVTNLQDETDRSGLRIVLELRRDANPNVILNNLYKHTQLQATFGINLLALVNGQPKVLNLKEMLECYVEHQVEVLTRRITYDLKRAEDRSHIIEGLLIALDDIDRVIQLIKGSKNGEEARELLISEYNLTEIQAKAILDMRLERLTGLETEKLKTEIAELRKFINECNEVLRSHERKLQIIVKELLEIKKQYGDGRRSEISLSDDLDIEDEDLIPVEDVIITITNRGYVKRMTVDTYRPQNRGGKGITATKMVEDDFVEEILYTSSHDTLLFFTNFGKVYRLRAFQIPHASRTAKGLPIVNLLSFEENERLAAVVNINHEETTGEEYLFFATRLGIVKKTEISAFKNIRTNGIKAIVLGEGDELFKVEVTDGEKDILIGVSNGKALRFSESDVRPMGRIATGVRGIRVDPDEKVVGLAIISTDGDEILIITEKGYGKRTNVDAFRVQKRGGKGVKALNITEKNGKMVSLSAVRGDEDLLVVTDKGMIIRTHVDQIQTIGRDTQGVCVIKLNDGHSACTFAIVPRDDDEEDLEGADEYREDLEYDMDYPFLDQQE
jgi:DNA gyrase subunit A